jgi:hypothetical protein
MLTIYRGVEISNDQFESARDEVKVLAVLCTSSSCATNRVQEITPDTPIHPSTEVCIPVREDHLQTFIQAERN